MKVKRKEPTKREEGSVIGCDRFPLLPSLPHLRMSLPNLSICPLVPHTHAAAGQPVEEFTLDNVIEHTAQVGGGVERELEVVREEGRGGCFVWK